MKTLIKKGATSYIASIFVQNSASTAGAGLTGLSGTTTGLVAYFARSDQGAAGGTQIVLSSGGTRGTWASGTFVEKDSANMPGIYEFGIPNPVLATGTITADTPGYVTVMALGASGMAPLPMEFQLTDFDLQAVAAPVTSNVKKGVALNGFTFTMTDSTTHAPSTGLTPVVQRSLDGGAFATGTNSPATAIAFGDYFVNLSAADLTGNTVLLRMTATGADDLNILLVTQP